MTVPPLDLRALLAETVRELVAEAVGDLARQQFAGGPAAPAPPVSPSVAAAPVPADGRIRTDRVRITDDSDLDQFARHLLALFENPKNRQDLRAGRLRFRLDRGSTTAVPADRPATRVDSGAVTERQVKAAAEAGHRLVLGRRAVLTPLGRERARTLGVPIEKEP
ncbi:hypothetical protein ACIA03_06620 [Nocardioides sp. NPDC051685]|uniref:hypothetical protein n=1 Tax=Nocardioides sp. NPDC051685 TaxID=3364334 RepID=UPI00378BF0CD